MTKLMYCLECRTYTNHCQLKSLEWICSCATIHTPEAEQPDPRDAEQQSWDAFCAEVTETRMHDYPI